MKTFAVIGIVALCLGGAFTLSEAQNWTWDMPYPLSGTYVEIVADPATGGVYGITAAGGVVALLPLPTPGPGTLSAMTGVTAVNDMAIGPAGQAYVCTNTSVQSFPLPAGTGADLVPQPNLPTTGPPGNLLIAGTYKNIAIGQGLKLYVLYTADVGGAQYLLLGTPPVITEGVSIMIAPQSLNLKSKGNWVTCLIDLPAPLSESDIDIGTIQITDVSIAGVGDFPLAVPILVAPGAPSGIADDGRLMVKFIRKNKANPTDPQSLSYVISNLLAGAIPPATAKFYDVTLTIEGQLSDGQSFEGNATIKVITANKKSK